jgi:hypothetical protein
MASVAAAREHVVALVESINQPQISVPGKPPQAVQAWLCGVRNAGGSRSVYAALHLLESDEAAIYVHEPRQLSTDAYIAAEAEGLQFLESMGFILEDLNFRSMAPEQQDRALARVQALARPSAAARGARPAGPDALARLLASL